MSQQEVVHLPELPLGGGRFECFRGELGVWVDGLEGQMPPRIAQVVEGTEQLPEDGFRLPAVRTLEVAVLYDRDGCLDGSPHVITLKVDCHGQVDERLRRHEHGAEPPPFRKPAGHSEHGPGRRRRAEHAVKPQYSLIERSVEREVLPFAEGEGIGVIVYSPMGSGMLTGAMTHERAEHLPVDDWRKHDERFNEPKLSENLALVDRLIAVAKRHDATPGAVAIAWTLRNPAVDAAIVGCRRPDQVDPLVTAANLDLGEDDVATT